MQSHHGLPGIGNNNTKSHQAQFGRLRFPIFSDSIPFTSIIAGLAYRPAFLSISRSSGEK
jgi:hypothetical protein